MIRICERCGNPFDEKHVAKYCPDCRPLAYRELENIRRRSNQRAAVQKKVDEAQGKPVKTLDDWAREARQCNLDYGTYSGINRGRQDF